MRKELLSKRILLSSFALEDIMETRGLKAFVGVTLVRMVPYHFRLKLLDYLLRRLGEARSSVLSVYECKPFEYATRPHDFPRANCQ